MKGIIAVGYGGLRVVSRDAGSTWSNAQSLADNGQDDDNLLRAVVYGKGLWLATGWKLLTSTDGVHWNERGKIQNIQGMPPCNIIEGLAFDGSNFYAACTPYQMPGHVWRSTDGLQWTDASDVGDTQGHLFLSYNQGKFAAYGDSQTTFTSVDGNHWQVLPGVQRGTWCDNTWKSETDCHDSSWFDGVYLRGTGQGQIARSTDGNTFKVVYSDQHGNGLYQSRAISAGYVSP